MAAHLNVAFLWHFHQPEYAHPEDGIPVLPWVRMHGVRGYTDLVMVLEEHPTVHATLNWTPVLLRQLERCIATWGTPKEDRLLQLCRRLPAELPDGERHGVVTLLFSANREHMIGTLPRYRELFERCAPALEHGATPDLSDADLLDLAVLFHLAWSGARLRRRSEVQDLVRKGRGFNAADLDRLLAVHRDELLGLLPRVRRLQDRQQVELTTTPDEHPILPLLCRLDSAEFPQSGGLEEPFRFERPDDAADHVRRALAIHERIFGVRPRGMWPAEGAVSEAAMEQLARAGVEWAASDEAIWFASRPLAAEPRREELCRPHELAAGERPIALFFRDHELSDRIGFVYKSWPADSAVRDFVRRLDELRAGLTLPAPVVTVILDGENPWEHFPGAGEPFLAQLHHALSSHERLRTVTFSEALAKQEAAGGMPRLERLARGSWIGGNLDTWAGQREKLDGWRMLARARALFGDQRLDELPERVAASLRTLEGSDWYWWFGDDHHTAQRDVFDELFHAHLRVVFGAAGHEAPPLAERDSRRDDVRPAREPLEPVRPLGRAEDLFEWQSAGWFELRAPGGSMSRARRVARRLLYGFEVGLDGRASVLHLGVECEAPIVPIVKGRVVVFEPRAAAIDSAPDAGPRRLPWLRFEIPLAPVDATAGASLRFRVELETVDGEILHWPGGRLAAARIPGAAFQAARWYV